MRKLIALIGAMVFSDPLKERIQFNGASLWTDGANRSGENHRKSMPSRRQKLRRAS